jgi:lipopolysaccharide transport system ATP-binding protein
VNNRTKPVLSEDEIAISVRNVSKNYRLFNHPGDRIKQFFSLGIKQYHREFTALNNVTFDIRKGETVGIIGRNGSGKSTLLQLVCGILKSSSGSLQASGRVSALLELGAGFNPEFTGRENVYFQGAILGLNQSDMAARFEAIADFADIGEFMDQPVRTYSSGMFVRLAFAVAISVDPDILVVDEALSVGDSKFQLKCAAWLQQLRLKRVTVLLVSHDENLITSLCDKVIVMEAGRVFVAGEPRAMSAAYHKLLFGGTGTSGGKSHSEDLPHHGLSPPAMPEESQGPSSSNTCTRYGTGEARLVAWGIRDGQGRNRSVIESGTPFRLYMVLEFRSEIHHISYGFAIKNQRGTILWGVTNISQGMPPHNGRGGEHFDISAQGVMWLAAGDYYVTLGASHMDNGRKIDFIEDAIEFQVVGPSGVFTNSVVNLQIGLSVTLDVQHVAETSE